MVKYEFKKRIIVNETTSLPMDFFNSSLWTRKRKFSELEAWMLLLYNSEVIIDKCYINGMHIEEILGKTRNSMNYYTETLKWSKKEVIHFIDYLVIHGYITYENKLKSNNIDITIHDYDKYVLLNKKYK